MQQPKPAATLPQLVLILLVGFLLSACTAAPASTPTLLPPAASATQPPAAAFTPAPSPQPSQTPPPSASPTLLPGETPPAPPLRFVVIGDYGEAGQPLQEVAALIKSWVPDLILTVGDNNYPEGAAETIDANIGQYFSEYIYPYQGQYGPGGEVNRFFPALGNHDLNTDGGQAYFDYFSLPGNERYYDFTAGPVHFFALNSDWREPDGIGALSAQAEWLRQGLAASTLPWQIVYFHVAPYSSGYYGSEPALQWHFGEWGADAVLTGHEHHYERLLVDGLVYFINGLGGGARYPLDEQPLPETQRRFRDDHGAMLVEATADSLSFQFVTRLGQVIDSYQISKDTAAPAATTVPPAAQLPAPDAFTWQPFVSGLSRPVGLVPAADDSGRLFALEQAGRIRVIESASPLDEPFLDITERVGSSSNEQGLLGLAFHPDYANNGFFYLNYTDKQGNTVIARYSVGEDPNRADPESEQRLLYASQPYPNHNGGHLEFGSDGLLYIGLGDGGSAGDPQGNAQNPGSLLGKLLRLDVDDPAAAPEIYALGLRNPWRFSFDPANGDLYIADVGQNQWEEVNYLEAGAPAGANFGWDYREASYPFEGIPPAGLSLVEPVAEYDHSQGCSITGGVVYHGARFPALNGVYLYADYCSGVTWGLLRTADGGWLNAQIMRNPSGANPVAFAQNSAGNLFMSSRDNGVVYKLAVP